MRKRRVLLLSLTIGLAGCQQHPAGPAVSQESAVGAGEIGSRLPDLTLTDLQGRPLPVPELRGKVVLIDFWATWCQPCRKEMPGYQKLLDRYGSRGFEVIGLKFDSMRDTEDPAKFAAKIGVRYPLAVATDAVKNKFGGIEGLPTTLLYDRQGILHLKVVGFEYTENIESALKPLL